MYNCEQCHMDFETFQAKANHIRWKHNDNTEYIKNAKKAYFDKVDTQVNGKWIHEKIKCYKKECNNLVLIKYREGKKKLKYFCSLSCANSHKHSDISKHKCSNSIKSAWKKGSYDTESFYNGLLNNLKFSSIKEREIIKYFKNKYPDQVWKSGGSLKYKNSRISRDLYSDILKICFEYDGIWHFKNIHDQLDKKIFKDKLLEEWCIENGYRLIRIDELEYINYNQLEKLFFENTDPIIKIGKRY